MNGFQGPWLSMIIIVVLILLQVEKVVHQLEQRPEYLHLVHVHYHS